MSARGPIVDVESELGRGATGSVSRGRLREPFGEWAAGTEVAVKTLLPEVRDQPAARASLANEAAAAARVEDPSLARVLHLDQDGVRLVLEYIPGRSLRETLDEDGPLPEPLLRRVGAQVAGALAALHAADLVHGDVKPENIRLDAEGRAVLVDLGFSADAGEEGAAGTLRYLSPERARGGGATPAADVFALGSVLYELACGRHPLGDESVGDHSSHGVAAAGPEAEEFLGRLEQARFAPPSRWAPELSALLDELLEEILSRAPADRPAPEAVRTRLRQGESSDWWRERVARDVGDALPARSRRHLLPLVGREEELGALSAHLDLAFAAAAEAPRGSTVWLSGPAGSGKSRLVEEFVERARRGPTSPLYLYGRCQPYGEARPSAPLLATLRRWLALPPRTAPGPRERERLEQIVPPHHAEALLAALDPDTDDVPSLSEPLARWILALADRRPLVLFLDDMQRADGGTLSALRRLADRMHGRAVALIVGVREDESPALPTELELLLGRLRGRGEEEGGPPLLRLELEPLPRAALDEAVRAVFHHSAPHLRLGEELWRRSRGNPGLLAEVLRDAVARGAVRPHSEKDARLVLTVGPEELPHPASLGESIGERLRATEADDRRWLERLAVVGGRIEPGFLLRAFHPTARHEVDEVLARLVRTGWLAPAGALYRFARPALREAIYRATSERRRLRLHAAASRALAPPEGEQGRVDDAFQRAFHLRAARHHSSLVRVLRPLLAAVRESGQAQRVLTLARWGLEALDALADNPSRDRLRVEFLEAAADAADRLGRRAEQRELLDRLADLPTDPDGRPELAARVYLLHGRYAAATGANGMAGGLLRNAVELASRAEDGELASEALRRLANVRARVGELAEARQLARRAARATDDPRLVALAWLARALVDVHEGRLDSGLRTVARALRVLRRRGSPVPGGVAAVGQLLRARILRSAGLPARALAAANRARVLATRAGERRLEAEAGARVGAILLDLNHPEEAEARLRDARLLAREIEDARGETLASVWLGLLLWECYGPEAGPVLDRAVALAEDAGYARAEALARALRARLMHRGGDLDRALSESGAAQTTLERVGAELFDRVAICGTRVLVLRTAGRDDEATALLAALGQRMERDLLRLSDSRLRAAQRRHSERMIGAVLSPDGVVFPRRARPESPPGT